MELYNPHLRSKTTTASIMKDVCLALLPASLGAVYFFGFNALLLILVSIFTCVASEFLWQKAHKEPVTIFDFSAVVTGILLAFNVPSTCPIWALMLADVFAIIVVKQFFGGIGSNVFNPALMGRLFLMVAYPSAMMKYVAPTGADVSSTATLLSGGDYSLLDAFIGKVPGALGETSAILLFIGFAYLVYKKEVNWLVSLSFFTTVLLLVSLFGENPLVHLSAGGLVLGGCFMLTDYNFASGSGHILYGVVAGIIVAVVRCLGTFPEAVCYAILLANCMAPLIDQIIPKHVYGIR